MSLESWQGFERFLSGKEEEEWLHMTSQETPDYLWEHEQNRYEASASENDIIGDNYYKETYSLRGEKSE